MSSSRKISRLGQFVFVMVGLMIAPHSVHAQEACSSTKARIEAIDPMIKGEIAALQTRGHPKDFSNLSFKREDGSAISMQDLGGKLVLFNLWATWCAPCKKEMPDLDEVQAKLGGENFEVVTVSLDRKSPGKPRAFFDEIGIKQLDLYYDEKSALFPLMRSEGMAFGLPTTLLLDKNGCSIAHLAGPAAWSAQEAIDMLKVAIGEN